MDIDSFRKTFAKSPIKRIKHNRFIRNVCVAIGNTGTTEDIQLLEPFAAGDDALVAEHAQ